MFVFFKSSGLVGGLKISLFGNSAAFQYKLEPEPEADPRSFASLRGVRKSSAKANLCDLFHLVLGHGGYRQ
jgi:hypothetical protein